MKGEAQATLLMTSKNDGAEKYISIFVGMIRGRIDGISLGEKS